ncbi:hypothetical protein CAPTEDRAFT_153245 [Capitella teleta]|uniref:C2H2-type domain-containing protein n=1 Tax=Capitella teleta TaxID=283909 RepID=R7VIZ1_CAPTE|nr:hypothetical protein CAPTEDRAFT_153245 [Capitella teleta]|eukprot:ELU15665.1 hypothetical protein CAPTEDRAFT_153245 [Capitella teleta]
MAVFLINQCKFTGCGLTFATLSELIQHIEETHIDNDPKVIAKQEVQQPDCLALSYVLRLFTGVAGGHRKDKGSRGIRPSSVSPVSMASMRSATPTGSEFEEDSLHSEDENSDNSWTTQEEFTSELILSMMSSQNKEGEGEKPFSCPVPGCKKRYKNINGIKYHAKHGHKDEVRVRKPFKCKCGKSYRTASGLRNHSFAHHSPAEMMSMGLLQNNTRTVPPTAGLKMLSHPVQLTSAAAGGKHPQAAAAILMRPGGMQATLHTLPVTLANMAPSVGLQSPPTRIAAAIPCSISQIAPLLQPATAAVKLNDGHCKDEP